MTNTVRRFVTASLAYSKITALALVPVLAAGQPAPASAAACGERKALISYLTRRYKEQPKAIGLVSTTGVMEILVSDKGSWSILVTMTNGRTCIVAAGQNWEDLRLARKDPAA